MVMKRNMNFGRSKFLGYMRLQKLHDEITGATATTDPVKNCLAFAGLVQCLDGRSLSLIIRDAKDDVRKSLVIIFRVLDLYKNRL